MTYYPGFGRVFDDFFNGGFTNQAGVLKTDIVEKDGNYVLSMEVPGYKKEDIQIALSDGYLKVTATKQSSTDDKDDQGRIVRKERYSGTQSRSFYVGDNYHQQDIKASFDNGELTITLPTEAKKIEDTKQYISIE
ncbi:Hsp20/alpha crystallin family protein [Absicoccus intestinalis]|uniref:Hsp20/alpha crystallin family protein n=1 Tax=Absicoccus intestinalis TaxID=2926319 RepID=A0ABU4WNM0_9FIRM|nr:Hsp20/alpha crystallin family protein [Absicoccus sp. CLA-KB-P134]MDX8418161.1 Hsp20/alpha crystallin family protein [Absicoccus sp. CLA-KB-P134]